MRYVLATCALLALIGNNTAVARSYDGREVAQYIDQAVYKATLAVNCRRITEDEANAFNQEFLDQLRREFALGNSVNGVDRLYDRAVSRGKNEFEGSPDKACAGVTEADVRMTLDFVAHKRTFFDPTRIPGG